MNVRRFWIVRCNLAKLKDLTLDPSTVGDSLLATIKEVEALDWDGVVRDLVLILVKQDKNDVTLRKIKIAGNAHYDTSLSDIFSKWMYKDGYSRPFRLLSKAKFLAMKTAPKNTITHVPLTYFKNVQAEKDDELLSGVMALILWYAKTVSTAGPDYAIIDSLCFLSAVQEAHQQWSSKVKSKEVL